jgi:RNA polymerase sigma factor (sigma-70 family)
MDASDADLVKRALAGDRAAFGPLVERHRSILLRLAHRMLGDPAEAEDVAQEACLHAFLSLSRLRAPERFGAWLYGIAVNLCRLRLRARRSIYALEDWEGGRVAQGFTWAEAQLSPEAAYEIRELHAVVLNAIALLPPEQQVVVRLHYLDGLTLTEIGVLAGAPLGTVKARLHRARERLRASLAAELAQEFAEHGGIPSRKEKLKMIEVVVQDVIMRVSKPKDVVASREAPGPGAEDVRVPLPPDFPAGQGIVVLQGDEKKAEAVAKIDALPPGLQRVVLLKEKNGERILPIWIGPHEGDMLKLQLAGKSAPRPLTYDLMVRLLDLAHVTVERVAVSRLHAEVFYATLWVRVEGKTHEVDARPSDALNLALRAKAPIFVAAEVMDAQAVQPDALPAKLVADQSSIEGMHAWVSVPAPELNLPTKPC